MGSHVCWGNPKNGSTGSGPPRPALPHKSWPRKDPCQERPAHPAWLLPNGSALDGSASQFLEPQQHGEHSFELAVEMHLVTTKPLQPVWVGPLRAATERFGAKLDALHKDHKAEIIRLKLQR